MKWVFVDKKNKKLGKDIKSGKLIISNRQMDTVGNILQKAGAIEPKACQKCEVKFKSKQIKKYKMQKFFIYECKDCKFTTASGDQALEHMWLDNHKIKKVKKEKPNTFDTILEGILSYVEKIKNVNGTIDVKILCRDCSNG